MAPYRLDLTVSVLRRSSTNVVDLLTPDGQYRRVLGGVRHPVTVDVTQVSPEMLEVTIEGDEREHRGSLVLVRRMLGVAGEPQCFLTEAELRAELLRAGFEKDPPGPLTEYNRPVAGLTLTRAGPVIFEGTFRTVRHS